MGAFIVLLSVLADLRSLGPLTVFYEFRHGDKVGHAVLYGGLALLINLAVGQLRHRQTLRQALQVAAVLAVITSLEELSQELFPSRSPDPFDLLSGLAGIVIATGLALALAPLLGIKGADDAGVELGRSRYG